MIKEDDHIHQRERKKDKDFWLFNHRKKKKRKKNAKENKENRKKEARIKHIILLGKETKMKLKFTRTKRKKKQIKF